MVVIPLEFKEQEEDNNDCNTLKNLRKADSLNIDMLPYINQLRGKINLNKEWSVGFEKKWTDGNMKTAPLETGVREGIDKNNTYLTTGNRIFAQIHSHPKGTQPMFSWNDIKALEQLYLDCNESYKNEIFLMFVAKVGTTNVTYTLKVTDFNALSQALQNDLDETDGADDDEKKFNIHKFLEVKYGESTNLEQTFLELYGNHGISLYKAEDDNLNNWTKLELGQDSNNANIVNPTPCE